jgi:hypothetical protein
MAAPSPPPPPQYWMFLRFFFLLVSRCAPAVHTVPVSSRLCNCKIPPRYQVHDVSRADLLQRSQPRTRLYSNHASHLSPLFSMPPTHFISSPHSTLQLRACCHQRSPPRASI